MWGLIVFHVFLLLPLRRHTWNQSFWDPGAPMLLLITHRAEMTHDCWALLKFLTHRLPSNEIIFALNPLLQGNRHQRQKYHGTPGSDRKPTGGHWGRFTEEAEFELDLTGMSRSSGSFFYSAAQEHVSYLRRKTQQNSHLSKYKTKAQRTRNFAFEVRKNASLLLPSERDHWGVNNIIPYMCSKTLPSSVFLFKLFSTLRSVPYFSSKSPSQPHQVTLFAAIKTC